MAKNINLCGSTWQLRMRVPVRYRQVEKGAFIKRTLKTDSKSEAEARAPAVRMALLAELDARLAGQAPDLRSHHEAIAALAVSRGHGYQTAAELAQGNLAMLVGRLARLQADDPAATNATIIAADLGGVERPIVRVLDLPAEYEKIKRAELKGKTEDQRRRWRNPFKRAADYLAQQVGNGVVEQLSRKDAMACYSSYLDRVEDEEILADTANKELGFLRTMIRSYRDLHGLDPVATFDKLRVKGGRDPATRSEFSEAWIRETLYCENPLPGTNSEVRDVLIIMSMSGGTPSEITGALPHHFRLDDPIPHIQLRNEGRRLKNPHRVRDLIVVGPAREAAERHRDGMVRYRHKPGFSDTANAYLRENKLLPTEQHTIYSLRHSFQGCMRRAGGIDQFFQARMMGHSAKGALKRESYGDDLTLEQRLAVTNVVRLDHTPEQRRAARQILMDQFMSS